MVKNREHSLAKSARIELRTSPEVKKLVSDAASLSGMTVSEYINASMQSSALRTIERMRLTTFTKEEVEYIQELMVNPKPLNEKLTKLLDEHRAAFGNSENHTLRAKPRIIKVQ